MVNGFPVVVLLKYFLSDIQTHFPFWLFLTSCVIIATTKPFKIACTPALSHVTNII